MITIDSDMTAEDVKRLAKEKELRDLAALRAILQLSSYRDSEERLEEQRLVCEAALRILEEAYLTYDDEEPNVELAIDRARHLEAIERDVDRAIKRYENIQKRVEWERKQAQR